LEGGVQRGIVGPVMGPGKFCTQDQRHTIDAVRSAKRAPSSPRVSVAFIALKFSPRPPPARSVSL
jgi:hypothetical protein